MRSDSATRARRAGLNGRSPGVQARYALAAPILLLLHGPAQAAEELIEMSQDDAQWVMPAKNYASTRFSGLDQITPENVRDLQVAWTFSTGLTPGHEAAPLVVGETMYLVTPYPNILYALDIRDGSLRWTYRPEPERAAQGVACCDLVNRGAAYFDGKIFYNTLDNHTVAVDAESGEEVWKTKLGTINRGETMTMAPLVVKGKVLVGNSGGELGVRGWLTALEADTGEIAWRAYSTGPDSDVLIGEEFEPFYPQDREPDLGVTTWPPGRWEIGAEFAASMTRRSRRSRTIRAEGSGEAKGASPWRTGHSGEIITVRSPVEALPGSIRATPPSMRS